MANFNKLEDDFKKLLEISSLCSNATEQFASPTEKALLDLVKKSKLNFISPDQCGFSAKDGNEESAGVQGIFLSKCHIYLSLVSRIPSK